MKDKQCFHSRVEWWVTLFFGTRNVKLYSHLITKKETEKKLKVVDRVRKQKIREIYMKKFSTLF